MSSEASPRPNETLLSSNHGTQVTGSEVVAEAGLVVNLGMNLSDKAIENPGEVSRSSTSTSTGKRKDRGGEDIEEVTSDAESSNSSETHVAKRPKVVMETEEIHQSTATSLVQTPTQTGKRKEREKESNNRAADAQAEEEGSTSKRQRQRTEENTKRQPEETSTTQLEIETTTVSIPPFFTLPTELKIEILVLTGSPKHLLAVSRTCQLFRRLLLDENGRNIWRNVRKACTFVVDIWNGEHPTTKEVKLPDPPPGMTEVKYAAFLFDSAKCEVRHDPPFESCIPFDPRE